MRNQGKEGKIMEKEVCLTHSKEKLEMALKLGFADYAKRYDRDCIARKFKKRFADKFGADVYAWYDMSRTAYGFTPIFRWVN